jgi:hypothetical protein
MSVSSNLVNGLLMTLSGLNNSRSFEVVHSNFSNGRATVIVKVDNCNRFEGSGSNSDPEQARVAAILTALTGRGLNLPQ